MHWSRASVTDRGDSSDASAHTSTRELSNGHPVGRDAGAFVRFRQLPQGIGAAVLVLTLTSSASGLEQALAFAPSQALPGAPGGTEPQLAVAPDGTRYAMTGANTTTNSGTDRIGVYRSSPSGPNGGPWRPTAGDFVGARSSGPDVTLTVTKTGRLVALEQDSAALSLLAEYSDDGGATWTASTGLQELADQDRPWLAAGPGQLVYLLFHNGFSSNATHNMYVETSTDGGASFGPPIPLTVPGTPEWLDLQCVGSGGPSALLVNPKTGRLYAIWGSRHGTVGSCGVLPAAPFTLVPADRIWVSTSPDASAGSWTSGVAVDYSTTSRVVGMQLSPAALDTAGNLYLAWTTPPNGFPDDSGAGISVMEAGPLVQHWTAPRTIVTPKQPGAVLAQLVAGAPGNLAVLYLAASPAKPKPLWNAHLTTVLGLLSSHPVQQTVLLETKASYQGTATALMGSGCDTSTSPTSTITSTVSNNPITCPRSSDVIGLALDQSCRLVAVWPSLAAKSKATLGTSVDATWITTQTAGPRLCSTTATAVTPADLPTPHTASRPTLASTGLPTAAALFALALISTALVRLRRRAH